MSPGVTDQILLDVSMAAERIAAKTGRTEAMASLLGCGSKLRAAHIQEWQQFVLKFDYR